MRCSIPPVSLALAALLVACAPAEDEDKADTDSTPPVETDDTSDTDTAADTDTATDTSTDTDTGTDTGKDTDPPVDTGPPPDPFTWPATADAFTFGASTVLSSLVVPDAATDACCEDFGARSRNGAGTPDNAASGMLTALTGFGIDVAPMLAAAIEDEDFTVLFEHVGIPQGGGDHRIAVFRGAREGSTDWAAVQAGTGTFTVDPEGFEPGTGTPKQTFWPATLTGDQLVATAEHVELPLPWEALGGVTLALDEVTLRGTVVVSADGATLTDATIGGLMPRAAVEDLLFAGVNSVFAETCACATSVTGPLFTKGANFWTGACKPNGTIQTECADNPDVDTCVTLAGQNPLAGGLCIALSAVTLPLLDVDTNGSPNTYEAMSFGARLTGATADIVGLTPATP